MRGLTHRPGLLETFVAAAMLAAGCGKDPSGKPTAPPPDLKALVAQADAMAARGLNVEAALHLKPWLESFPQSERGAAQLRVARFYHGGNVHDLSLKYAEAAIAAGTVDPEALYITGDAQRTLFKAEARATLERLLALEPGHCLGRLSLARLLFRAADPASSLPLFESYFEAAAPDDPHQPVAVLEHARALRAAGRCQEAADRFAMLLEQDPLDAKLYSELASALYRLKLRKEARFVEEIYKLVSQSSFDEHVEARLRETGATAFALGQQAANRTRQRRYLEAFTAYRRAIEVDPVDPRLRIYLADLCIQFRRFPEAHGTLDEGLRRSPPLVSGVLWLKGLAHVQKDELREALRQLQLAAAALEREGNQGGEERGQAPVFPLNLAMGRCAIETGDLEGARAAIERAAQASPSSWEPSYWRGRIALAAGDPDGALQSFDDAARRGGRDLMDLGYYGALALARKGQVREALGRLKQVVERSPGFQLAYESFLGLARDDPVEAARVESVLAELKAIRAELAAREKAVAAKPLEECGADYLEMAKLALRLKEPGAYNWLFLASDLLPESAEAAKLLVAGMKQPQDLFVRVHFLRRLLVIEPEGEGVLGALAEVYVKLHVRLEEARRLAERLHARRPSALSHRLLGKALALLGDREKGLEVLRSGLAAFPGDKDLAEALAEASGTGSAGKDGG